MKPVRERGGFQIRRSEINPTGKKVERYLFELYDTKDPSRVVEAASGRSPIAPAEIRATQARLNTKLVMDLGEPI